LRSQSAVEPIEEAVSEIKKAGLKDYALGGEEAVLFLEKVSQAIEQVEFIGCHRHHRERVKD